MENPGSILQRARRNRSYKLIGVPSETRFEASIKTVRPTNSSAHADYTALMRSHDRVRTRHIRGQGGENGA